MMRKLKSAFTFTSLSILLTLGIQHSDLGEPQVAAVASVAEQLQERDSFAIRVDNYDETINWYRENLNATVEGEWKVPQNPDARLAYLNLYGFRLKVVSDARLQTDNSETVNSGEYQIVTPGLDRPINLQVDEMDALMNKLTARGMSTLVQTANSSLENETVVFVEDNNGNLIRFVRSLS